MARANLGAALHEAGRREDAAVVLSMAAAGHRRPGNKLEEGSALDRMGAVLAELGRDDEGIAAQRLAVEILHETPNRLAEGRALANLGVTLTRAERLLEAWRVWERAESVFVEAGDEQAAEVVRRQLAALRSRQDRPPACVRRPC